MKLDGHVLVIGAAGRDSKGRSHLALQAGTSNPGTIHTSFGGVGRNMAENLGRLGAPTVFLTVFGEDTAGELIIAHMQTVGVNMSYAQIVPFARTGSYIAVLDEHGELSVAVSDFSVMNALDADYIRADEKLFADARFVLIDLNMSIQTIDVIIALCQQYGLPLGADPTSVAHTQKIVGRVKYFDVLLPNTDELAVLVGEPISLDDAPTEYGARQLVALGVDMAIVTLGSQGVAYATANESGFIESPVCEMVDATGAGDALSAGVVFGLINDLPLHDAIKHGIAAACLTVSSTQTVATELSVERLQQQITMWWQ